MPAARQTDTGPPGHPLRRLLGTWRAAVHRQQLARRVLDLRRRSGMAWHERIKRVRIAGGLALQAGLAGAIAWFIAHNLLGYTTPVFAPIAAVGTLASSVGQRLRRTVDLVIGVALGIGIGDALVVLIGVGTWQLALIVTLAVLTAVFLGGGAAVVNQAAGTGVLLATLSKTTLNLEFSRVVEALVGGLVALGVATLLLPLNPMRVVDHAAEPALDKLARELAEAAEALKRRDHGRARAALDHLREAEEELTELKNAIEAGRETAALSPARWGKRTALSRYVASAEYLHRVLRNSGALVRRAVTLIEDEEPVPPTLPHAVRRIGEAISVLHYELSTGLEPEAARERALRAVHEAGQAYRSGVGLSGSVVVAQIRTIASDLIRAGGIDVEDEANRLVRQAAGRPPTRTANQRPNPAVEPTPETEPDAQPAPDPETDLDSRPPPGGV